MKKCNFCHILKIKLIYVFFKIIRRILLSFLGLIWKIIIFANNSARDIENCFRYLHATIDHGNCISNDCKIGRNVHIYKNCIINHSEIGDYSYVYHDCLVQNTKIGNYCSIAHEVIIGLGNHPMENFSTSPIFYKVKNPARLKIVNKDTDLQLYKEIMIGHDVWIGARAIIMDGVKIGNGAVVAAGAVVTKNVPPYTVVGGIPAKIIKNRAIEDNISRWSKSEWWNLSPDKVLNKIL
jgi:acetyltransferase-like isoleucine patch superfamily enzyme